MERKVQPSKSKTKGKNVVQIQGIDKVAFKIDGRRVFNKIGSRAKSLVKESYNHETELK
jgi:hypothetical protein